MTVNAIVAAIESAPINRAAYLVASQKNCEDDISVSSDDLQTALMRLIRKQRLLKKILRIKTVTQHKNLKTKFKRGIYGKGMNNPRALLEYMENGQRIDKMNAALLLQKSKERRNHYRWYMAQHYTNAAGCGFILVDPKIVRTA